MSSQTAIYSGLSNRYSFRLLRFNDTSDDLVSINLRVFDLDQIVPPFYALSYCWGSQSQKVLILCNSQKLEVTASLHECMEELLRRRKTNRDMDWYWIDQLSINQNDMKERSHQVSIMRQIYEKASRTLVWLGPGFGDDANEFDKARHIAKTKAKEITQAMRELNFSGTQRRLRREDPNQNSHLDPLGRIIARPWFRRMCVIQELVVSSGKCDLLCGPFSCSWNDFGPALLYLQKADHNDLGLAKSGNLKLASSFFPLALKYPRRTGLYELLQLTRLHEATDLRDKVYALIGLALETQNVDPQKWPQSLRPNYESLSPGELFRDVTRFFISTTQNLNVLSDVFHDPAVGLSTDFSPSWAVRWGREFSDIGWVKLRRRESFGITSSVLTQESFYKAALGKPLEMASSDHNALRLRGLKVDTICNQSDVMDENLIFSTISGSILQKCNTLEPGFIQMITSNLPETSDSSNIHFDSLRSPILQGYRLIQSSALQLKIDDNIASLLYSASVADIPSGNASWRDFWAYMLDSVALEVCIEHQLFEHIISAFLSANIAGSAEASGLVGFYYDLVKSSKLDKYIQKSQFRNYISLWKKKATGGNPKAHASKMCVCYKRRFFVTSKFVGLGPGAMQKGDIICIIYGSGVPFVLRPTQDHYLLVGECYVCNLMNGEALRNKWWKKPLSESEWFTIR
jgi:hypothetical protein